MDPTEPPPGVPNESKTDGEANVVFTRWWGRACPFRAWILANLYNRILRRTGGGRGLVVRRHRSRYFREL